MDMNESSGSVPRGPYVVLYSLHGLLALIFRLLKIIAFPKPPARRAPGGIHSCADKPTWALPRVRWFCNGENPRAAALLDSLLRASTIVRKRSEPQGVSNHPSLLHTIHAHYPLVVCTMPL